MQVFPVSDGFETPFRFHLQTVNDGVKTSHEAAQKMGWLSPSSNGIMMCQGEKGDQDDGCIGRSRGGLITKIHALVDAEGRPIDLRLSAGQVHDSHPADDMLDIMRADTIILADKAYDSNAIRAKAKERGAWANIPPKRNRKASVIFSKWVDKQRNAVERFFNKIKQFRAIATRYEKNPLNFLAAIKLVAALV